MGQRRLLTSTLKGKTNDANYILRFAKYKIQYFTRNNVKQGQLNMNSIKQRIARNTADYDARLLLNPWRKVYEMDFETRKWKIYFWYTISVARISEVTI